MATHSRKPAQTLPPAQLPAGDAAGSSPQAPLKADVQWTCKTFALDSSGQLAGELPVTTTVGSRFQLTCEGPPIVLNRAQLSLELPKMQQYQLKILDTRELTDGRAEFIVTSWSAGDVKLSNPVLTDGAKRIGLGDIHFSIASVIDKKTNPEPKPFGPWSPVLLPLPVWIWFGAIILIVAVVSPIFIFVRRRVRRRKLLKQLAKNPITMTPYFQFNKELRKLVRQIPNDRSDWSLDVAQKYVHELDECLRWFLARELVLPVFARGPGEILRDLKRGHSDLFTAMRRDFTVTLGEIEKARQSEKRVTIEDAQQITELARGLADRIHKTRDA
jgi:hypothetical protein